MGGGEEGGGVGELAEEGPAVLGCQGAVARAGRVGLRALWVVEMGESGFCG